MPRTAVLMIVLFVASAAAFAQDALPKGAHPPALDFPHFPSRLHAFVWRNWNLVETTKLAEVVGAIPDNIRDIARSMALEEERPIPPEYRTRLYLTIIRRNWHLLPYEQLLKLLDITPARLEFLLHEDDFLWIKLGSLKPKCDPIRYVEPDAIVKKRADEIAAIYYNQLANRPPASEEPFAFLKKLSGDLRDDQIRPTRAPPDQPRFLYSYFAVYGDSLLDPSLDPFPDRLLQKYADAGVNGVWLHVVLRDLAPSQTFPNFGKDSGKRLANLAKLVARAKRFGIGIYLYLNEPRSVPVAAFKEHEALAGVREGELRAMCTSQEAVRKWLGDSVAHVFTKVPDLAGAFTITASENLTHCASHFQSKNCPRCKDRSSAQIIAEVNATINAGVRRGNPNAKAIAWDWGWRDEDAPAIIAALPRDIWLMSVSEWSLPIERGGIKSAVGEYSISAVGPGPRAQKHWSLAKDRGLKTVAKIAANNTWEFSAVPAIPVLDLIGQHAANLSKVNIDGLMMSWTLGGYPSSNLELFGRMIAPGAPSLDEALNELAKRDYGDDAPTARKAWKTIADAFEEYPYNGAVLYNAPQQFGPSNLLFERRTGYSATMIGFPYDDLAGWRGHYPPDIFAAQFAKVAQGFNAGAAELEQIAKTDTARDQPRWARAAAIHFASVANQARFIMERDKKDRSVDAMRKILEDEIDLAKRLLVYQGQDSRIGFEASNHYYYLSRDLMEKVLNCRHLLARIK